MLGEGGWLEKTVQKMIGDNSLELQHVYIFPLQKKSQIFWDDIFLDPLKS